MEQYDSPHFVGRAYEKEVCQIFQAWFGDNVTITCNQWMEGASGVHHELDFYMELKFGGILFHVAVECKAHVNIIGKANIMSYESLLRDLNKKRQENEKLFGIFISKNGFQSGAVDYAWHSGILLLEIREPDMFEWCNHYCKLSENVGFLRMNEVTYFEIPLTVSQRIRVAMDLAGIAKEGLFHCWKDYWKTGEDYRQDAAESGGKEILLDIEDKPDIIVLAPAHHIGFWIRTGEDDIRIGSWYG